MSYLYASLGGRCANGAERDQGTKVHAVPWTPALANNSYATHPAACGARPGPRSVGWSRRFGLDARITCPRCAKVIARQLKTEAE